MPLVPLDSSLEQRSQRQYERHNKIITRICKDMRVHSRYPDSAFKDKQRINDLIDGDMQTLHEIVHIDPATSSAWVEPNVTMEMLVQKTLLHDLIPLVVAGSRTVLVGDAFAAPTTGSSSFEFGTFNNSVVEIEIVQGNGQCVIARIDNLYTSELIIRSAEVLKSVGRTTLLNIVLLKAGPFVDLSYWPVTSVDEAMQRLRRAPLSPPSLYTRPVAPQPNSKLEYSVIEASSIDYVEGFVFNANLGPQFNPELRYSVIEDSSINFVEGIMHNANSGFIITGRFSWYLTSKDTVATIDYLFRHGDLQRDATPIHDIGIPTTAIADYIMEFHVKQRLWPIRVYPLRLPENSMGSFGISNQGLRDCWNISFFRSSPICDSNLGRKVSQMDGFKYLKCRERCDGKTEKGKVAVVHLHSWKKGI
jgi:hypothetical protein